MENRQPLCKISCQANVICQASVICCISCSNHASNSDVSATKICKLQTQRVGKNISKFNIKSDLDQVTLSKILQV